MKRWLLLSLIVSTGCGIPNNFPVNPNSPKITVSQTEHEIRLTPIIDGKPIEIKLDISALDKGSKVGNRCECGCGKEGCVCNNSKEPVMSGQRIDLAKPSNVIEILTIEGCAACTLALNDLRAAGYNAKLVYGVNAQSYPTLRSNGKTWSPQMWYSNGSSVNEAKNQLNLK